MLRFEHADAFIDSTLLEPSRPVKRVRTCEKVAWRPLVFTRRRLGSGALSGLTGICGLCRPRLRPREPSGYPRRFPGNRALSGSLKPRNRWRRLVGAEP